MLDIVIPDNLLVVQYYSSKLYFIIHYSNTYIRILIDAPHEGVAQIKNTHKTIVTVASVHCLYSFC